MTLRTYEPGKQLGAMSRLEVLELKAAVEAEVRRLKHKLTETLLHADFVKTKAELDFKQNLNARIGPRLAALNVQEKRDNVLRETKRVDDYRGRFIVAARLILPPDLYAKICKEAE